ncbi:MAG: MmgE/PrpD family protein [Alphaproteobacteria bacterium]|nr:MmgE/PrpD family protein [Alphaproteobacteria bacterium]
MSDPVLARLAQQVATLDAGALPPRLWRLARLRHLSFAGAVRQGAGLPGAQAAMANGPTRGSCSLVGSERTLPRRDALRFHVAAAEAADFDDLSWSGPAGSGAVAAGWAWAKDVSVGELLLSTLIGAELAARFNAATLLGPRQGQVQGATHALATAAAAARLQGLSPEQSAEAWSLALVSAGALPWAAVHSGSARGASVAAQALTGLDAATWAESGLRGPDAALEGAYEALDCAAPLRSAFDGLGGAWHAESISYKLTPGAAPLQVPVEAVHEILRRHVKAADKRLRADQVERIDLKVAAPSWAMEQLSAKDSRGLSGSIARSIGALVVAHGVDAAWCDPSFLETNAEAIQAVAERVTVEHYWPSTLRWIEHLAEVARPLLSGLSPQDLRCALGAAQRLHGRLPTPSDARELVQAGKARPDRLLAALTRPAGELDPAQWSLGQAVEVKLYTSRGGWWPERRSAPDGSNAVPEDKRTARVIAKFAGDDADRRRAAEHVLALPPDAPAAELLDALRA